jgi:hypothetical protein
MSVRVRTSVALALILVSFVGMGVVGLYVIGGLHGATLGGLWPILALMLGGLVAGGALLRRRPRGRCEAERKAPG